MRSVVEMQAFGRKKVNRVGLFFAATLPLLLAGCFKPPSAVQTGPSVTIQLSQVPTVVPGETVSIYAAVYDLSGKGVTWTFSPEFGALGSETSTSVMYTAPAAVAGPTTVIVTATSVSNPLVTASVKVPVFPLLIDLSAPLLSNSGLLTYYYGAQTVNQGQQLLLNAFPAPAGVPVSLQLTWSLSPSNGAGSLSSPTNSSVVYIAPSSVSSPTTVTITAQSASPPATSSIRVTVLPSGAGVNVAAINVDGGPVPGHVYPNAAFTSVTLCNPGSITKAPGAAICQTVDGILVDTGSSGLRILQSQIPLLSLPGAVDVNGNSLQNCDLQVDGSYLWGPVVAADVYMADEVGTTAEVPNPPLQGVPVQMISSSTTPPPLSCSNGGVNENTPQLLGANGILGIGPEPTDCTVHGVNYCDGTSQSTLPNLYYACPSAGCSPNASPVLVNAYQQVGNPIPYFAPGSSGPIDNNGVILQFPPVSGSEAAVTGTMTFGVSTQGDNLLGSATVLTLDSDDHFTTLFADQTLTSSYIDSGFNGFFFPDSLAECSVNSQYFCPSSLQSLTATNTGATQGQSVVSFSVDNADNLLNTNPSDAVFGSLAGPNGTYKTCSDGQGACSFIWGLPFFYGRTVYILIDGQNGISGLPAGPWVAY